MLWFIASGALLAAPIPVSSVVASSSYPTEQGVSYEPAEVLDHRGGDVWVEGASGSGLGSWIELRFAEPREVVAVQIHNGHWLSPDFWKRHNRMKDVELIFSDGSKQFFKLPDRMAVDVLTLPKPVTTKSVRVRFTSVYAGSTFGDTAVAELAALDASPAGAWTPASAKASTTYPADADGTYEAANLSDGLVDTMWCEGDKAGDGVGQWVELDLGAPRAISKLRVVNGNAGSAEDNAAAAQPREIELVFDDGTVPLTLAAGIEAQSFEFPKHTAAKARLNIRSITPGGQFTDACISELELAE